MRTADSSVYVLAVAIEGIENAKYEPSMSQDDQLPTQLLN
jgi:hypothetical protein